MSSRRAWNPFVIVLVIGLLLSTAVAVAAVTSPSSFAGTLSQSSEPTTTETNNYSQQYPATVTISDENNDTVLGTVNVSIAETPDERYTGLSDTDVLPPGYGMLFVYDEEANRAFVMREMNFPLDIIFIGADGKINVIHHAPVPQPGVSGSELTRYQGEAKWVLEVPCRWTDSHNITAGDEVSVER